MLSIAGLFAMHVIVDVILLCIAWRTGKTFEIRCAVAGTATYQALTICAELLVLHALCKLMSQEDAMRK